MDVSDMTMQQERFSFTRRKQSACELIMLGMSGSGLRHQDQDLTWLSQHPPTRMMFVSGLITVTAFVWDIVTCRDMDRYRLLAQPVQ